MPPELDQMNPDMSAQAATLPSGETDREGAMAKADLYKLANYSHKLFQQIQDEDQLEGWVQAKITKAADYIASVYHYLEYEMKFSEYGKALDDSDVLSEGQKRVLKTRLNEAKSKVKELKKVQAEKIKDKSMAEGVLSGGHTSCAECGGTGMVYEEPKAIPDHVKAKVEKYKRQATAFHAAGKRIDANKNGIPDEDEMEEDFDALKKTGDTTKTSRGNVVTKTDTGVKHERPADTYTDGGDDIASNAKSGKGVKSHAKGETAAEKKEKAPAQKQSPKSAKTWGMKDSEKFDNRDGAPAKPKKPKEEKTDETYGQGVYEAKKKGDGNLANNAKPYDKVTRGDVIAGRLGKDEKGGKTVKEAAKWRDPKYKDKLYTQEPRDPDDYFQSDDDYYNPKPDDYPGAKHKIGGSEYDHNDPLRTGYGRLGTGSLNTHGKRKGMPSRDHIRSLKGSIKDAHGTHPHPNLPEAAPRGQKSQDSAIKVAQISKSKSPGANLTQSAEDALEKGNHKKIDQIHQYATTTTPTGRAKKVSEAKPSAGLSAAKKSAVVKDAKAGKDIGKPGKSFAKTAKAAGGGEKGEKIAAAAMWNSMKEDVKISEAKKKELADEGGNEFVGKLKKAREEGDTEMTVGGKTVPVKPGKPIPESADLTRIKQFLTRLNG